MNYFVKSHGLGNDYIVIDEKKINFKLNKRAVKRICDRNYRIGSDGLLVLVSSSKADFGLRIFNPDGSEAEKSGNGLRIFSKFLYDNRYTNKKVFTIETKGGLVKSHIIKDKGKLDRIKVEMGKASFDVKKIPFLSNKSTAINEHIKIGKKKFIFTAVTVGNPHCVIFVKKLNKKTILEFGPMLEANKKFPRKTNVQFAQIISRKKVKILIWERGAGYTLASGSSSCAVASAGYKLGIFDNRVEVNMDGGNLIIDIDNEYNLTMEGSAEQICSGNINLF